MSAVDVSVDAWRKSTRSGNNGSGGNCVEVGFTGPTVAVRDSKEPEGAVLAFSRAAWASFLAGLR
ncbi:DUF397 domain-containing protein [Actinopolyspora mortivallis]|uniref:DUF397 domain-containing protein n=1 Tax=Actinopolyspora mortivallis TaxID=33906 RepID=A0A2T0GUL4_ACTMO|nr:DUF397 domain-containing protein [Actinopolyspora mortivallis]PRW62787.1 DUF397 domain-containing protein [Actinopolyspora mortivallis]